MTRSYAARALTRCRCRLGVRRHRHGARPVVGSSAPTSTSHSSSARDRLHHHVGDGALRRHRVTMRPSSRSSSMTRSHDRSSPGERARVATHSRPAVCRRARRTRRPATPVGSETSPVRPLSTSVRSAGVGTVMDGLLTCGLVADVAVRVLVDGEVDRADAAGDQVQLLLLGDEAGTSSTRSPRLSRSISRSTSARSRASQGAATTNRYRGRMRHRLDRRRCRLPPEAAESDDEVLGGLGTEAWSACGASSAPRGRDRCALEPIRHHREIV